MDTKLIRTVLFYERRSLKNRKKIKKKKTLHQTYGDLCVLTKIEKFEIVKI